MEDTTITIIMRHGGTLLRDESGRLEYEGGEMDVWEHIDTDTLNTLDLQEIAKACKNYFRVFEMGWRIPETNLEFGLRSLNTDRDVNEMSNYVLTHGREVEVLCIHPVMEDDPILSLPCSQETQEPPVQAGEGVQVEEDVQFEEEHSTADESAEDSHYKPSPVETSSDEVVAQVKSKKVSQKKGKDRGHRKSQKRNAKSKKGKRKEPPQLHSSSDEDYDYHTDDLNFGDGHASGSGLAGVAQGEVLSDHSYKSEEFNVPISTDEEDDDVSAYPQFNEAARFGNVSFEVGLEFTTLESFKKAVREYTPYEKPQPPNVKRSAGRPKKNRRKDGDEGGGNRTKLKKQCPIWVCSRCGIPGHHNSRGCTNSGVPLGPLAKKARVARNTTTTTEVGESSQVQSEIELSQSVPVQSQEDATDIHASQPTVNQENQAATKTRKAKKAANKPGNRGKRYGMRGPVIPESAAREKNTPIRPTVPMGPVPQQQHVTGYMVPNPHSRPPFVGPFRQQHVAASSARGEQVFQFIPTPPGLYQIRPRQP